MRLNEEERKAIVESFRENFGEGRIYLFGSRVDVTRYGGDIDLYVELEDQLDTTRKKTIFW